MNQSGIYTTHARRIAAEREQAEANVASGQVRLPKPRPVTATACRFVDLGHDQCRFPVGPDTGRDRAGDQLYCGGRRIHANYCPEHQRAAYGSAKGV